MTTKRIAVVGCGIFGVTAAIALRRRGYAVTVYDPGPIPHPDAASTDINKFVRLDYGSDEFYMAWMEETFPGWFAWNQAWPEPLYHNSGVLYLVRQPMTPGTFEYESFALMTRRGHTPVRLDAADIVRRFPAWHRAGFVDGYFNPLGGYAETARVVAQLAVEAEAAGVSLRAGQRVVGVHETEARVAGVVLADGSVHGFDEVLVAAGAWTHALLPWLAGPLTATGMPVHHIRPTRPEWYTADVFPPFGAAVSTTGWYGFPLNRDGVVKISHHGTGRVLDPSAPERGVIPAETAALQAFLRETFPELAESPIVAKIQCFYSDTRDGHWWIDRDPDRPGLTVAAGDSGHAIKFAPVLGDLIADALEGRPNPRLARFHWRPDLAPGAGQEMARAYGVQPTH